MTMATDSATYVREARLKTVTDEGRKFRELTGKVVPYNTPTDLGQFTEEFRPGTFADSIRSHPRVPLHMFHADVQPVAGVTPWPVGAATSWTEKRDGLHATFRLDDSEDAQRAAGLIKDGILNGLSVMFRAAPGGSDWSHDGNGNVHVVRRMARLVSVSLTSVPAYPDAQVTEVRHLNGAGMPYWYAATTEPPPDPPKRRRWRQR